MANLAGGMIPAGEYGDYTPGTYNPGTGKIHQYKQMGKDNAIILKKGDKEPPGWAVIILGFGDDPSTDNGPLTVTWADWAMLIPRNIPVAIPPGHFGNLLNSTETRYVQPSVGQQLRSYKAHRYNIQIMKWPDGYGETETKNAVEEVHEELKANYEKIEVG